MGMNGGELSHDIEYLKWTERLNPEDTALQYSIVSVISLDIIGFVMLFIFNL